MTEHLITRRELLRAAGGTIAAATVFSALPGMAADQPAVKDSASAKPAGAGGLLRGSFLCLFHPNVWDMQYSDECLFWKEENWRALIAQMHSLGMDTVIWANTAFWGRPLFPGHETTVGVPLKMGCADPLGVVADEADRLGMKVIYGVGLFGRVSQVRDYAGLEKPWPDYWFNWNAALAKALVDRYGNRPSFAGLYISYEIDFFELHIELYEKLVGGHIRPAVGKVPILASPGSLEQIGIPLENLPAAIAKTGIDILAPQDYGGRTQNVEQALKLAQGNAAAIEKIAPKLRENGTTVWANCESFVLNGTPDSRSVCMPGPMERIGRQIEMHSPLVDKLITWIYPGVMNKHTELVNIGHPSSDKLYDDYAAYLKSKGLPTPG